MRVLALDTTTPAGSVALIEDDRVEDERRGDPARTHAERLPGEILSVLDARGLSASDIDLFAVASGPGSFTGLRIACGLAQGLAVARTLPVYGVSSLAAMAEESGAQHVLACIDARMREVYYAALEKHDDRWREVIAAQCVAPEHAPPPPAGEWIGAGNGFAVYGNLGLKRVLPEVHPTAIAVAQLAAPRLEAGEGVDAALATPIYVRDKVAFTKAELASR